LNILDSSFYLDTLKFNYLYFKLRVSKWVLFSFRS